MEKTNIDNSNIPAVIFDTNFLLIPEQFKVDIFQETKYLLNNDTIFIIFDKTLNELEKISLKRDKHSISAKVGLKLIHDKKEIINIIKTDKELDYVDELLINNSDFINFKNKNKIYIATQDKVLKEKLKDKNIKIIYLAQKKILKIT